MEQLEPTFILWGGLIAFSLLGLYVFFQWNKKRVEAIELLLELKKYPPHLADNLAQEYGATRSTLIHFHEMNNVYSAEYFLCVFLEIGHIEYVYKNNTWEIITIKK